MVERGANGGARGRRTLVLAGGIVDDLETVVGAVVLEVGLGGPAESTRVGDALGDGIEGLDVLSRATEEHERDGAGGGWGPGHVERLAGGDNLDQRTGDGVTLWAGGLHRLC